MQDDNKKKSKVFGIPYVVIIFVAVATIPSLISDHITRNNIKANNQELIKVESKLAVTPTLEPTVVPTATPSAVPTLKKSIKYYVAPTTSK